MAVILGIIAVVVLFSYVCNTITDYMNKVADRKATGVYGVGDSGANGAESEKSDGKAGNGNESSRVVAPDTGELMFNALRDIGCQPTKNPDGSLSVEYQGENFHMDFSGRYALIWDPMWAGVKADDPDLPKIREAVNAANFNFGPTVVLTAPNKEGIIGFHSRRHIMLHPACPDNALFVKAVLGSFFDAKEAVRAHYHQINTRQMEIQQARRPIGFAANTMSDQAGGTAAN